MCKIRKARLTQGMIQKYYESQIQKMGLGWVSVHEGGRDCWLLASGRTTFHFRLLAGCQTLNWHTLPPECACSGVGVGWGP